MKIGGRFYTKEEIMSRVGSLAQLGGTRHARLSEGRAEGVAVIDFDTGSGLRFSVVPSRGLDISLASYKGTNLVYRTPNGEVHPAYYDARGLEWLRVFFGGLLTTCGLTYLGSPGRDGGEDLGLHGRYSALPAGRVADLSGWDGDEYYLKVAGEIEECALFMDKLRLTRTITACLGEKWLRIHDRVENFGYRASPLTILYHINGGFPLLDEEAELLVSAAECDPHERTPREAMEMRQRFSAPIPGFEEQNFLYRVLGDEKGMARAALINRSLMGGLGLAMKFDAIALPFFNEWKMMGQGDYVTGIEPCNVPCANRAVLRERGQLAMIEPGQTKEFLLELSVLEGAAEIEAFRTTVNRTIDRRRPLP
jgi:hypothetical protein